MLSINELDIKAAIVQRASDEILNHIDMTEMIRKDVQGRIDKIFHANAEKQIEAMVADAIKDGLNREYQRVNNWGEPVGEVTTIKQSLDRIVSGYWTEKVDPKTGKKASSDYNAVSRAEYIMTTVCADSFSDQMKTMTLSIAGHMKDGLRSELARQVDAMLGELFRVKSLQDQGKVEKPW